VAEDTRREPVRLFALWIAKDGIVLQWIGVAPEDRAAELAAIVESLRPLTPAGRDSIVEHRLRIVRARAGESLTALGRRNANVWIPARFALVNGVDADHVYAGGEPVKIAVALPYGGRRTAP